MSETWMDKIGSSRKYLEDGGVHEVIGLTNVAIQMDQPKVQMDTEMAMALCLLAGEALIRRREH